LYVLKGKFSEFAMKKDESVAEMFNWLNDIVNELKGLGFEVPDADFNHKFLRSIPERYDTIEVLLPVKCEDRYFHTNIGRSAYS